jgi:hypothetical protein
MLISTSLGAIWHNRMSLFVSFEHFLDFWVEIPAIFLLHFWKILDTENSFWN